MSIRTGENQISHQYRVGSPRQRPASEFNEMVFETLFSESVPDTNPGLNNSVNGDATARPGLVAWRQFPILLLRKYIQRSSPFYPCQSTAVSINV